MDTRETQQFLAGFCNWEECNCDNHCTGYRVHVARSSYHMPLTYFEGYTGLTETLKYLPQEWEFGIKRMKTGLWFAIIQTPTSRPALGTHLDPTIALGHALYRITQDLDINAYRAAQRTGGET